MSFKMRKLSSLSHSSHNTLPFRIGAARPNIPLRLGLISISLSLTIAIDFFIYKIQFEKIQTLPNSTTKHGRNHQDALTEALPELAALWGISQSQARCDLLINHQLRCLELNVNLKQLVHLNYPAIILLKSNPVHEHSEAYLLKNWRNGKLTLIKQNQLYYWTINELESRFIPRALMIWQPPQSYYKPIRLGEHAAWVPKLKILLNEAQDAYFRSDIDAHWEVINPSTHSQHSAQNSNYLNWILDKKIRAFQKQHALNPDGIVGPKTWIKLNQQQHLPLLR